MKIKSGFELIEVCGESVIVAHGEQHIDFSKVINLNSSAAYLWHAVEGKWDEKLGDFTDRKDFNAETLADLLMEEYEVDRQTALQDCQRTIQQWVEQGLAE